MPIHRMMIVAAAAALALSSGSAFAGWARGGTAYTARGEYNGAHFGSCGGESCSHAGGVVNPWGGVATNSGTVTRTAPGQFSNSGTAYGPYGRSVQHAGDTSCAGGACSHTGSMTGPGGNTATTANTVTRSAPGQYSSSGSVTGPNGNTSTHTAFTNCAGYTCNRYGAVDTAGGGTVAHSGSATSVAPGVVVTSGSATATNVSHSTTVVTGATVSTAAVIVAPPPPPPATVYVAPAQQPAVWVPGHWVGTVWVPAHWA
ncbi:MULTISPECIES: hypothetical protein [unclassified Caballeronia]|uniref:hypothetical protein n=1 Tax=unclassified Caballeronia TaxID=2646786 RepID=UPI00285D8AC1|nr:MULTISPECIES: hypothetical protein [unclassified Caballeronia]MDR5740448.1 hypothetical protein [Caballeronia sp. LZ016]MDR5809031.1 hypothetical protein [Caballeronia sp. LZ019]